MSLLTRARHLRNQHETEEAIALFVEYAQTNPDDAATAYAEAAECYQHINVLDQEIDLGPVRLVSQGDRENSRKYYRLALEADPLNVKALLGLSRLLRESDPERKTLLLRLLSEQENLLACLDLGDYLRTHEKNLEAAYALYDRAVEHFPRDKSAYLKLQDLCRRMNRPDDASQWSRRWKQQVSRFRPQRHEREQEKTVEVTESGWAVCPQCGFRFRPGDPNVVRNGRHRRCGQRIRLDSVGEPHPR